MNFKSTYILQFIFFLMRWGFGGWGVFIISVNLIAREIFCLYKISPFGDIYDSFHKTRCLILCRYERYGTKKLSVLVLCLYKRRLLSNKALKPPLNNGLSNIALTTMSFMFFGRLITVIDGSLKKASHSFVSVQNGQTIFKDALRTLMAG